MTEMEEERLRMREHVMKNVRVFALVSNICCDTLHFLPCFATTHIADVSVLKVDANQDRLVSLEEFLKSTEKKEFSNPREWEVKSPGWPVGRGCGRAVGGSNLWFKSQDKLGKCGRCS